MNIVKAARRLSWGVTDQAFSSLTNLVLAVLVARNVSARDFGAFSLAFATYIIVLAVARSITAEPLVVRYSGRDKEAWEQGLRWAGGIALLFGLIAGAISLVVAGLTHGALREAFLGLAVSFPFLVVQDIWRFGFFAAGRGQLAFANDFVWAVVLFPLVVLLIVADRTSVLEFTLAWGAGAAVAAVYAVRASGVSPSPAHWSAWLRQHRDLVPNYLAEMSVQTGGHQLILYGAGALSGLEAAGALRAGFVLLRPVDVLTSGLRLVAIPEAAGRIARRGIVESVDWLKRACIWFAAGQVFTCVVCGIAIYLVPDRIGSQLLGDVWHEAHSVVIPLSIASATAGIVAGASAGLRALAAARRSRRARTILSPLQLGGVLAGIAVGGPVGAAWGLAGATLAGSGVWWWHFYRALEEALQQGDSAPDATLDEIAVADVVR
jgi:O-antigen/teichoic acid export membrane protein